MGVAITVHDLLVVCGCVVQLLGCQLGIGMVHVGPCGKVIIISCRL